MRFTTAASLAHELIEAKDERRLMRFQKMLSSFELLIVDELGFVPLSKTGSRVAVRGVQPAIRTFFHAGKPAICRSMNGPRRSARSG